MLDSLKMTSQDTYMLAKLPGTLAFIVTLTIIPFSFLTLYVYQICFGTKGAAVGLHCLYWSLSLTWVSLPSLLFSSMFVYVYMKNKNPFPIWDLSLGVLAIIIVFAYLIFATLLLNLKVGTIL